MNKTEKRLREIKDKGYKLICIDSSNISYEDKLGYRFEKNIYNKNELTNKNRYDIKNKYCIYNINHMLELCNSNTRVILTTYKGSKNVAEFVCGCCGDNFKSTIGNLEKYKYKYCYNCTRKIQNTRKNEFEKIYNEVKSYGYELIDNYEGIHNRISVIDKDGYKGKVKLDTLRNGGSISKFALYNPFALDNLKLFCKLNGLDCVVPNQKYLGWEKPLKIKCSCGNIYTISTSKLINSKQYKCPNCMTNYSYLEDSLKKWLDDNSVNYIYQYYINECRYKKPLPFDFYLVDYNILIEIQGEQHYKPCEKFGGEKAFELQIKKDNIKKQYCECNNIPLILLSYKDIRSNKFKQILKEKLNI